METLTIGQVARRADIGVETVRFYEREKLVPQPPRRSSGYRQYPPDVVRRIRFIKQAKELGFSLKEIAELLRLRVAPGSTCAAVKRRTDAKIADIEDKMRTLRKMKKALAELSGACDGSAKPTTECPILDALYPGGSADV